MNEALSHTAGSPDAAAAVLLVLFTGLALLAWAWPHQARADAAQTVTTWPHLLRRELIATLVTLLLLSWWAMALELPLGAQADPRFTPPLAKAPWFFVGVQEQLQYLDSWLGGAVLPALMVMGLCLLPYLDRSRGRRVPLAVLLALLLLWYLPMVVGQLFRSEHWALHPAWLDPPLASSLAVAPRSLADLLGLGRGAGAVLGAVLCLGPLALLPLAWLRWRRRQWAARMGGGRFVVAGVLLLALAGVVLKVLLAGALDVRYLWVTAWFRI